MKQIVIAILCAQVLYVVNSAQATQLRSSKLCRKRKHSELTTFIKSDGIKELSRAAFSACTLPDFSCPVDSKAALVHAAICETWGQFPTVLVDIIVRYYMKHPFFATTRRWDLKKLGQQLQLQFDYPYGLIECSNDFLWLTGCSISDKNSRHTVITHPQSGWLNDLEQSQGLPIGLSAS